MHEENWTGCQKAAKPKALSLSFSGRRRKVGKVLSAEKPEALRCTL